MAYRANIDLNLFWKLTPKTIEPLFKAYKNICREERERMNWSAYLQGAYVRKAIASCMDKSAKYPDKPFDIRTPEEIEEWHASDEYKKMTRLRAKLDEQERTREERVRKILERGDSSNG